MIFWGANFKTLYLWEKRDQRLDLGMGTRHRRRFGLGVGLIFSAMETFRRYWGWIDEAWDEYPVTLNSHAKNI
jgi:hypothetical protein